MTSAVETTMPANRDHIGARLGVWLFLFTEILLFGGLFLLYGVFRSRFPEDFHFAAGTLDTFMGSANMMILLTSSLTIVLAVVCLERKNKRHASWFLAATMLLGVLFLVNKYFEWSSMFHRGLYPNSEILQQHTAGENVFYSLYYLMTGLHTLLIMIGLVILGIILFLVVRSPRKRIRLSGENSTGFMFRNEADEILWEHREMETIRESEMSLVYTDNEDITDRQGIKLENAGLYWHLVDVIWIFLFPLFYLIT